MSDDPAMAEFQRLLADTPPAVEPFYSHSQSGQPIVLYAGPLEATDPVQELGRVVRGSIALSWLPTPHVDARFVIGRPTRSDLVAQMGSISSVRPVTTSILPQRRARDLFPRTRARPITIHATTALSSHEVGTDHGFAEARFHLANFPLIHGASVRYGDVLRRARLTFRWAGWTVDLDETPDSRSAQESLESRGGYRLTHVGRIVRDDAVLFDAGQLRRLLEALGYFYAFAAGARCGPVLPVAFDASGHAIWAMWRAPGVDSWLPRFMWLDRHHGRAQLESLFPSFMSVWHDAAAELQLRKVIHYYAASNLPSSIDAALVLAFVALEILERWTLGTPLPRDADTRLRNTLTRHGIPRSIPPSLPDLAAVKNKNSWTDGPKALTEMRHRVAHPDPAVAELPISARMDAWLLVTGYIELIVLAIAQYSGDYRNRLQRDLWVGQVDAVPWRSRPRT
jgi:hypothetical protein